MVKKLCHPPASSAKVKSQEDSKRSKEPMVSSIENPTLYDIFSVCNLDGSSYAFTLLKMENMSPPVEDLG